MIKIWKYTLKALNIQAFFMPVGAQILSVQMQKDIPCMWVEVNSEEKKQEKRIFAFIPTGYPSGYKNMKFLATIQFENGQNIQHLYEVFDKDIDLDDSETDEDFELYFGLN